MDTNLLEHIARQLVAKGKGILAADESTSTIAARFASIGVESTVENRQAYRQLLFTAPGLGTYISGVIMFDETIRQAAGDGRLFTQVLTAAGVVPGIKVDLGTQAMVASPSEKETKGLDSLAERLPEYVALGARFAKWRAVFIIAPNLPTAACITRNSQLLAGYARMCQDHGLVPIVEPEVLMDGEHSIERSLDVTRMVQREVFKSLKEAGVELKGILLKPNMVLPGTSAAQRPSDEAIAEATLRVLRETVPPEVPGVVFLSGGQSEVQATARLDAMNKSAQSLPWRLSFSYGRALQASALRAWVGAERNASAAQQAFLKRAHLNSLACLGTYEPALEAR